MKILSKKEMKMIKGGKDKVVCVCTGKTNYGAGYMCMGDGFKCFFAALSYCDGSANCGATTV